MQLWSLYRHLWAVRPWRLVRVGGKRMVHGFSTKFEFSIGQNEIFDINLIKPTILGCVNVEKTKQLEDRKGVDYKALLRGGAIINIDAKRREPGASKYWRYGDPELALEKWSVVPCETCPNGKTGWTLSETSPVDMILYTFDKQDTSKFYLFPFQHLRMAFIANHKKWKAIYPYKQQKSEENNRFNLQWKSEAMFVPASVVIASISEQIAHDCLQ